MNTYQHSVLLDAAKCKGCTHCLKHCPTEAIRIREGRAVIDSSRCIDCGECIRVCPYKAKKAVYDKLSEISRFKWKIALPAPTLYGQFDNLDDIDYVLQGLVDYGFDEVYEVARAAELVSAYTREYMKRPDLKKPVISSACPVAVRLISLRFPYLCENVMKLLPPMEIAAMLAKREAQKAHPELSKEDIGVCFISPCPAKVSYVKNRSKQEPSFVDCVVSVSDIYFELLNHMDRSKTPKISSGTGMIGLSWATSGGESTAIFNDKYLAADGIENIIRVLDKIENDDLPKLEFIELNACPGGCVGGVMTVENPFIAKARLQTLRRYMPVSQNWDFESEKTGVPDDFYIKKQLEYRPINQLDDDRQVSIRMMADIQRIYEALPCLDCGSCGAPTCRAFAEDIVKGEAEEDGCIVRMREMLEHLNAKNKEQQAKNKEQQNDG